MAAEPRHCLSNKSTKKFCRSSFPSSPQIARCVELYFERYQFCLSSVSFIFPYERGRGWRETCDCLPVGRENEG